MPSAARERECGSEHSDPVEAEGPEGTDASGAMTMAATEPIAITGPGPARVDARPERRDPEAEKTGDNHGVGSPGPAPNAAALGVGHRRRLGMAANTLGSGGAVGFRSPPGRSVRGHGVAPTRTA